MRTAITILLVFTIANAAVAGGPYFYKGRNFGSEAMYNPLFLLLNDSYDTSQLDKGPGRDIFAIPYGAGATNVMKNLAGPLGAISRFGWWNFAKTQLLPFNFDRRNAQWWPNYQLHLIGGGMKHVMIREWYEAHGFSSSELWALSTTLSYDLLNEFVENGPHIGDNVDPIADWYFFDIPGIILFSSDDVCRFFSEDLNLADWSLLPMFVLPSGRHRSSDWTLQNNGQYFSVRWKLPFSDNLHVFYYFGLRGIAGLSYRMDDGYALSVGGGMRAKSRVVLDASSNTTTVDLVWNMGIFYDKDNSLLASLFLSDYTDNAITLNIYPGIVRIHDFSPGICFVMSRTYGAVAGVTTIWTPGIGISQK